MKKSGFWLGYLDAGSKSSAVLRDADLDTGNPKTVFLFNLERDAIIEYSREIVDAKLRQLSGDEIHLAPRLKSAYAAARKGWSPRSARHIPVVPVDLNTASATPPAANDDFDEADSDPTLLLDDGMELLNSADL